MRPISSRWSGVTKVIALPGLARPGRCGRSGGRRSLSRVRHVEVDDVGDVVDVEPAGGDVGRHQQLRRGGRLNEIITPSRSPWLMSPCSAFDVEALVLERLRPASSAPILVRVKTIALLAVLRSSAGSTSRVAFCASRGPRRKPGAILVDRRAVSVVILIVDRVVQVALGELLDRRRHRRREERRLAAARAASARIFSTSSMKPMSSISSASSRTDVAGRGRGPASARSTSGPSCGPTVATTTWAPERSWDCWEPYRGAAEDGDDLDVEVLGEGAQRLGRPGCRARGSG